MPRVFFSLDWLLISGCGCRSWKNAAEIKSSQIRLFPCYRLTTGNNTHASWGMRIIGGILPGMVDYILHALHGRLNAMDKTDTGGIF